MPTSTLNTTAVLFAATAVHFYSRTQTLRNLEDTSEVLRLDFYLLQFLAQRSQAERLRSPPLSHT